MAGLMKPRWRCAYWSASAISAAQIGALALVPPWLSDRVPGSVAEDDRLPRAIAGIGGHIGNASGSPHARDAGLVGGPREQLAEPAAGGLEGPALVSGVS